MRNIATNKGSRADGQMRSGQESSHWLFRRFKPQIHAHLRKRRHYYGDKEGFTLLEILVAMVLIGVGLLGISAMASATINASVLARHTDNCLNLAYDVFDRLHSNQTEIIDWGSQIVIDAANCVPADPNATNPADDSVVCAAMQDMNFRNGNMTIDIKSDDPIPGLVRLIATVEYGYKGEMKKCQIVDIVRRAS